MCAGAECPMVAQISRQRSANQRIRHDEPVCRERAHPAIDVQSARSAIGQHGSRQHRGDSRGEDGKCGSLVAGMRRAKCAMGKAVVRHKEQYTGSSGDAAQRSRK